MGIDKTSGNELLKTKLQRGQILKTLAIFYPREVQVGEIKLYLMAKGNAPINNLETNLQYLIDSDLICKLEGIDKLDTEDDLLKLTKLGVNLIEGDHQDVGVMV